MAQDDVGARIARIGPGRLAKAITAPSGILTFGGVTAAAILGLGASAPAIAGAAVIGAVAWIGGAAWRIARASKRADQAAGRADEAIAGRIDPFAVGEPWRRFVTSALRQQNRYSEIVASTRRGPIRDRLASIGERVDGFIVDVWDIARRGDTLHAGLRRFDLRAMERDLAEAERELAAASPDRQAHLAEIVASRRAAVESGRRLTANTQSALDRLRSLDADLERLVVNAVEVSATASSAADLDDLDQQVDLVVDELDGLRQAMDETEAMQRRPVAPRQAPASAPAPGGTPMPG